MSKVIEHIEFDSTLSLTLCHNGWWLYDETRSMNLSMRAKTKEDAFFEALKYYQERCIELETDLKSITEKVDNFINLVNPPEDF